MRLVDVVKMLEEEATLEGIQAYEESGLTVYSKPLHDRVEDVLERVRLRIEKETSDSYPDNDRYDF